LDGGFRREKVREKRTYFSFLNYRPYKMFFLKIEITT